MDLFIPEDKKEYDRDTAMETIKATLALGYRIDARKRSERHEAAISCTWHK